VLDELVSLGAARRIDPQHSGKPTPLYVAANMYYRGEPFKVPPKNPAAPAPPALV
jgi:hypothetical protein